MISRRSGRLGVALAVLAVGAGACAGGGPEETVRTYFEALAEGDGGRACNQLTLQLRRDIEESPGVRRAGRRCEDVMGFARGLNPELSGNEVEKLEIEVDRSGERAVARLENPLVRRRERIDLVEEDGDWRIASLETRPRR